VRVVTMDRWWSDALKGSGRLTAPPAQTRDTTKRRLGKPAPQ
jgi:hypothetical protein